MVASELKDLTDGSEFILPSNARSIMLEVDVGTATSIQLQTSHDGTTWHDVGSAITGDSLTSFDDASENFLQKVRVTGATNATSVKLFFGRSK